MNKNILERLRKADEQERNEARTHGSAEAITWVEGYATPSELRTMSKVNVNDLIKHGMLSLKVSFRTLDEHLERRLDEDDHGTLGRSLRDEVLERAFIEGFIAAALGRWAAVAEEV